MDIKTTLPYTSLIKGDAKVYTIAAASILAKVTRDRIMREIDKTYPQYLFAKHLSLIHISMEKLDRL